MRGWGAAILFVTLLAAGCAAPPIAPQVERNLDSPGPQVWAYHAHWMADRWRDYDLRDFHRILFFDLVAGKDGGIAAANGWPAGWGDLRRAGAEAGVPVDPVVSVLGTEAFRAIFSNPARAARLAAEVSSLARDAGGVHLDVEIFDPVDERMVEAYRSFLANVRRELDRPPRKVLTAFVPGASPLYGERELALLDAVVAQGYDAHWQDAKTTGPVALLEGDSPVAWKTAATSLVARGVPPRRIVFSTPLYGYEWPAVSPAPGAATTGKGAIVTYAPIPSKLLPDLRIDALSRVAKYGLKRDAPSGAPWYAYYENGKWRQGWFDDAVSLGPRLDFVRSENYLGVALWILGYDGGAILDAIRARLSAKNPPAADASRRPAP
jgi:spore germination protein YaaH